VTIATARRTRLKGEPIELARSLSGRSPSTIKRSTRREACRTT